MMKLVRTCLFGMLVCFSMGAHAKAQELIVFAAASLTDVLNEIGADYTRETHIAVKFSFAASSALARQIESGAPAQVFFSADTDWMDYLQARDLIVGETRRDIVGNRLVLIAPASSHIKLRIEPNMPIMRALDGGRLATGDPDTVPVGKYAKAALLHLGVWDAISARLVRADNVRSALAFVARGEAPLGIVYQSDARIEKKVHIVATFPLSTHPPIIYPASTVKGASTNAVSFVSYLQAHAAQSTFKKYGFEPIPAH